MTQVLFVQGGGEHTHDQWDNKLVDNLRQQLGDGYEVRYPRMPNEADPNYARWKAALRQELARLDNGAIVVGHSIGGTILVHTLADEQPDAVLGGIFLVAAPFVGDGGWPSDDIKPAPDLGRKLPKAPVHLYHGSDDETAPVKHLDLYAKAIPQATTHRLKGRDHQLNDDLSEVAAEIMRLG